MLNCLYKGNTIRYMFKGNKIGAKCEHGDYYMQRNLFDKDNMDGTYSNRIAVITGQHYRIYRIDSGGFNTQYRQIDSEGKILSDIVQGSDGIGMRADTRYLQINTHGNTDNVNIVEGTHVYDEYYQYKEFVKCKKSKWNGKRWLVLGDSISTGNGERASVQFASMPYHYLIAREKGIIVTNHAVSGYTTSNVLENKVNHLIGSYYPDLITIFCGTNDVIFSCDTEVWYDALLTKIKEKYPNSTIGVILPLDRMDSDNRLVEKVNIIKDICLKHDVKYLDMFKNAGWDFKKESDTLVYTCNNDGLHPNNLGHSIITPSIDEFIESL